MQTPTHFILAAALQYPSGRQRIPLSKAGLLLGSVLPDIPFTLLTIVYSLYYRLSGISVPAPSVMEYLHFDLFFNDPVWIIGHNTFHSLFINGGLLILGYWLYKQRQQTFLFWLAASMLLHTIIDIFTHISDGPLFLFPLNWTYRFRSSLSYWESGSSFIIIEYLFDALLIGFLLWQWRKSKIRSTPTRT